MLGPHSRNTCVAETYLPLPDEARQPAIGEDLATGLTWREGLRGLTVASVTKRLLAPPRVSVDSATTQPDADLMAGPPPSDDDRLKAIRAHADGTMRYYATAFVRETEENRDLIRSYMSITANFLALLDRDGLDDRSMVTGRDKIIQQYVEQAKSDPWEPGNCSFCGERPVAAWFEGPSFRTFVRQSTDVRAEEAWLACATCLALVEKDDRDGLARRGARREGRIAGEGAETIAREMQSELFWEPRDHA